MALIENNFTEQIIDLLKQEKIGVIPTDTIYGVVGQALQPEVVHKIYHLRKRTPTKPVITLIANAEEVVKFGVLLTEEMKKILGVVWPGKVSVVLVSSDNRFRYLQHPETQGISFRVPDNERLREILRETGPLIAPSANLEGEPSAETIEEAKEYFGERVDFYVDAGKLASKPSTLVKFDGDKLIVLRQGVANIPSELIKENGNT